MRAYSIRFSLLPNRNLTFQRLLLPFQFLVVQEGVKEVLSKSTIAKVQPPDLKLMLRLFSVSRISTLKR